MASESPLDPGIESRSGPAVLDPGGATWLEYGRLRERAEALAGLLESAGVGPGSLVCSLLANGPAFAVALLGAWRAGATFAPVSPQLTGFERRRVFETAQPDAVLADSDPGWEEATLVGVADDLELASAPVRRARPRRHWEAELRSPGLLLFTSGSTGTPKGVVLDAGNVRAGIAAVRDTFSLVPEDRTVALLPWTHGHGLLGVLLATLASGGSVAAPDPHSDPTSQLARIGATWASMVPPQLALATAASRPGGRSGPRLRFLRTASAPLPVPLAEQAEEAFGCPVAEAYGMTETSHQAASNPPDRRRRFGTVGTATGTRFRLGGEPVAGAREVEVQGPAVFRGYLGRPDLTGEVLGEEGWYRTGDLGEIDAEGYVRLHGRIRELINRGGHKVSPVEVEEALAAHPAVSAAIVAPVRHAVLGEEVGALVVLKDGADASPDDLRQHCAERLADYKRPALVRIVAAIPRLPNGKPSRRLAADALQEA